MARFGPAAGIVGQLTAGLVAAGIIAAAAPSAGSTAPIRIGVSDTPPFAIRHADGSWSGIAVDLANTVSARLDRPITFERRNLSGLLEGLRDGSLDVVAGPITITPDHREDADFTAPYFATILAVATRPPAALSWGRLLSIVFSPRLLHVLFAMAVAATSLGVLVWLLERRRNSDHFEAHPARGVWSAVWWAAATLTTVGYGDKTPRSVPGRLVAIFGMIVGIVLVSILTATFASEMTLSHMRGQALGADDLRGLTVGSVAESVGQRWLAARGIRSRAYPDAAAALDALEHGTVEAVIELDAVLRWEAHTKFRGDLHVQQIALEPEFLAFALPRRSDLRETVDHAVLGAIHSDAWTRVLQSYLGKP